MIFNTDGGLAFLWCLVLTRPLKVAFEGHDRVDQTGKCMHVSGVFDKSRQLLIKHFMFSPKVAHSILIGRLGFGGQNCF